MSGKLTTAGGTRTVTEAEFELAVVRERQITVRRLIDGVVGVVRTFCWSCVWIAGVAALYFSVEAAAGKSTQFNAVLDVAARLSADRWIAYIVASLAGVGYVRERRLRQATIRDMHKHIEDLERRLEPNRTSSRITAAGKRKK